MSKHLRHAFFQYLQAIEDALAMAKFLEPARWFINFFEGEFEGAVVHRDEPLGAKILENFDGFVGTHVDVAKGFGVIRANGKQRDLRRATLPDFLEATEVRAIAGVIDAPAMMFDDESAIAAMMIVENARAPMFARREGDLPFAVEKTFEPLQFDDALEAQAAREIAHAPGHDANFRRTNAANTRLVKVIEVRVREQDEIDRRKILELEASVFDALQQEKPVREIGIDEDIEVGELHEKRRVTDPGDGDFAGGQFGKLGALVVAGTFGQERLPHHFFEESARIEGVGGCQVPKRARQPAFSRAWVVMACFWIHMMLCQLRNKLAQL
jgi:hypothetical protein